MFVSILAFHLLALLCSHRVVGINERLICQTTWFAQESGKPFRTSDGDIDFVRILEVEQVLASFFDIRNRDVFTLFRNKAGYTAELRLGRSSNT